jgi:chorismate mutase/prephenate dehydratase
MSGTTRVIEELRAEMAKIDAQLLTTLDKRARTARAIGEVQKQQSQGLPLAERAAVRSLLEKATGDMPVESLRDIFREVLAACVALEVPSKVSYFGPEGGSGHAVARAHFGASATYLAADSTAAALDEVVRGAASFAVLPYETHTDGPVQPTIVALTTSELRIVSVIEASPSVHLYSRTGNVADIEKIYATAGDRALAAHALAALGAKVNILDVRSPLVACELAFEDHGAGAVATEVAGAIVGLEIAQRNILDRPERVRYAIIGARPSTRTGEDLTALVFSVNDAPGALLDVLKGFAEREINLTKIQSRPVQAEGWSYLFFLEVAGHATDRALVTAFDEVKRLTKFFKVLGSYPAR